MAIAILPKWEIFNIWRFFGIGPVVASGSDGILLGFGPRVTPTSSSWLNEVEGFFAKLARHQLKRDVFYFLLKLQSAINPIIKGPNVSDAKPFIWKAGPDELLPPEKKLPNVGTIPLAGPGFDIFIKWPPNEADETIAYTIKKEVFRWGEFPYRLVLAGRVHVAGVPDPTLLKLLDLCLAQFP